MILHPHGLAATSLLWGDWAVLGGYFAVLIGAGVYFSRRRARTTDEYFLANRSMPAWAVAFSILATAQSAATFVGVPEQAYAGDLSYLASNIGGMLAAVLLATVFIPAYYRLNVTTPYQLLTTRFGEGARQATSIAYLVGRVFASGARVFVGSLPASLAIFGDTSPTHMAITIAGFVAFGIVFTFVGGVSSVIWTDVLQVTVYLGAAVATIAIVLSKIPLSIPEIIEVLAQPGPSGRSKLHLLSIGLEAGKPNLGFDPAQEFSLLTCLTGFVLLTLASHGMDQDLVQRMLTCKSAAKGSMSVMGGVVIGIPAVLIFLTLGLLLYVYYARPDVMGAAAPGYRPEGSSQAFQVFALREMTGGLAGLFLAGLFAAGPAGINSGLNSMSSTFVSDLYRRWTPGREDGHYLRVGRLGVLGAGVALGLFALVCTHWFAASGMRLIGFVLSVMNFAYAGLLGVFGTALFTRRGSTRSAIAALVVGFVVVLLFQPIVWGWWTDLFDWTREHVRDVKITYAWHLVIGSAAAFGVCCLGRGGVRRGA